MNKELQKASAEYLLNEFVKVYEDLLHPNITDGLKKVMGNFIDEVKKENKDFVMSKELQELEPMLLKLKRDRKEIGESMADVMLINICKTIKRLYK